jgi:hypothetical protein
MKEKKGETHTLIQVADEKELDKIIQEHMEKMIEQLEAQEKADADECDADPQDIGGVKFKIDSNEQRAKNAKDYGLGGQPKSHPCVVRGPRTRVLASPIPQGLGLETQCFVPARAR